VLSAVLYSGSVLLGQGESMKTDIFLLTRPTHNSAYQYVCMHMCNLKHGDADYTPIHDRIRDGNCNPMHQRMTYDV